VNGGLVERVWHPLLGKRSPQLAELVERCDAAARATLVLAVGLARRRIELQARLAAELQAAPWAEPAVAWRAPSPGVTSTDLLRALLARHHERIAEVAFGRDDVDASFMVAVDRWRSLAAADTHEGLELDVVWARSWALLPDAKPIDLDTLLGCLTEASLRRLAAFSSRFVQELITEDEAFNRVFDNFAHAGVRQRFAMPMSPAYWDRHGGLCDLDRLLARPPGVVIVGSAGCGRHQLVEAWGRRLRTDGPAELRRFGFNIDNFHGGGELEWKGERVQTYASVDTRCICVLSQFGAELREGTWPTERRFPEYCLDFANDPANEFRLVIVTTPEQLVERERQLPALRDFARIEVPPIADPDLLPLWICQLPAIEHRLGIEISLPRLIDRLAWRSPDRWRDFAATADLACESELAGCERSIRAFVRRARTAWSEPSERRLAGYLDANPPLARLCGDPGRWTALVALADALHGLA
jgi:hypothetical protein